MSQYSVYAYMTAKFVKENVYPWLKNDVAPWIKNKVEEKKNDIKNKKG